MTAYVPLIAVAFLLIIGLYMLLHHSTSADTQPQAMLLWRTAALFNTLAVVVGVVQVCAMWSFARSSEWIRPAIGGSMYCQPVLLALTAAMVLWNLTNLYRDTRKVMSAAPCLPTVQV